MQAARSQSNNRNDPNRRQAVENGDDEKGRGNGGEENGGGDRSGCGGRCSGCDGDCDSNSEIATRQPLIESLRTCRRLGRNRSHQQLLQHALASIRAISATDMMDTNAETGDATYAPCIIGVRAIMMRHHKSSNQQDENRNGTKQLRMQAVMSQSDNRNDPNRRQAAENGDDEKGRGNGDEEDGGGDRSGCDVDADCDADCDSNNEIAARQPLIESLRTCRRLGRNRSHQQLLQHALASIRAISATDMMDTNAETGDATNPSQPQRGHRQQIRSRGMRMHGSRRGSRATAASDSLLASFHGFAGCALFHTDQLEQAIPHLQTSLDLFHQSVHIIGSSSSDSDRVGAIQNSNDDDGGNEDDCMTTTSSNNDDNAVASKTRHREYMAAYRMLCTCYKAYPSRMPLPDLVKYPRTVHLFDAGGTATTQDDLVASDIGHIATLLATASTMPSDSSLSSSPSLSFTSTSTANAFASAPASSTADLVASDIGHIATLLATASTMPSSSSPSSLISSASTSTANTTISSPAPASASNHNNTDTGSNANTNSDRHRRTIDVTSNTDIANTNANANAVNANIDVVIEEKIDGSNLGISICPFTHAIMVQNRSHYISQGDHAQYSRITEWLESHRESLHRLLQPHGSMRKILYGEWMAARHSIQYHKLPGLFVAFDIYDERTDRFVSRRRFHTLMEGTKIPVSPTIHCGPLMALECAHQQQHQQQSTNHDNNEQQHVRQRLMQLLQTKSMFRTDGGTVEGIVIRIDDGERGLLVDKYKVVRPDFVRGCSDGPHWSRRTIEAQRLDQAFAEEYLRGCYPLSADGAGSGGGEGRGGDRCNQTK
eukprot:CAMPEP_0119573390 /NCGR_PEP_ID=MMETSP1352-20130426/45095_1 /TAXON_ID=265584 /ORGANISM="Stauroneis constricta, Strain CCMP1120" /LENGTH=830 /DNA_ID=CAMNT_0007623079 /DNA_START=44 /DNA_END=2537 /DNA_ORIENTATION=+